MKHWVLGKILPISSSFLYIESSRARLEAVMWLIWVVEMWLSGSILLVATCRKNLLIRASKSETSFSKAVIIDTPCCFSAWMVLDWANWRLSARYCCWRCSISWIFYKYFFLLAVNNTSMTSLLALLLILELTMLLIMVNTSFLSYLICLFVSWYSSLLRLFSAAFCFW